MEKLEKNFTVLLLDCERILKPQIIKAEKWYQINKNTKRTIPVIDKKTSLHFSFIKSLDDIKKLKSFAISQSEFNNNSVFANFKKIAGYNGTFIRVLQFLLVRTCDISPHRIIVNINDAISKLRQLREISTKKSIDYIATTRIIGATTTIKKMTFPDSIKTYRLSLTELNNNQPIIQSSSPIGMDSIIHAISDLELILPISVPIDFTIDSAFFRAQNEANKKARNVFNNFLDAILLVIKGKAILGALELHDSIDLFPIPQHIPQGIPPHQNMTIKKKDIPNIYVAYELLSRKKENDKILNSALHRFLLGRKRTDFMDKLVDYVIAWESLLLTQEGNPIKQEQSYRFSLNGASILVSANRKVDQFESFSKMKTAYLVRSTIVHGGDKKNIDKHLNYCNFQNLQSLCDFLESSFRDTIFWLASKKVEERPYRKHLGWEKLIWPS